MLPVVTCDADASVRGCPCPGSRRWRQAKAGCRKRGRQRVSGGQDARSERPALGAGQARTPADRVNYWMLPGVTELFYERSSSASGEPTICDSPRGLAACGCTIMRLSREARITSRTSEAATVSSALCASIAHRPDTTPWIPDASRLQLTHSTASSLSHSTGRQISRSMAYWRVRPLE